MARCFLAVLTFAVVMVVALTKSRTKPAKFRKLSEKEATANSTWAFKSTVFESKSVRVENCGPPASLSITPWLPVPKQMIYYELNFTSAHTVLGGELSYYENMWPYEIHYDVCDYIRQQRGITMCPLKKGETYMYQDRGYFKDHLSPLLPKQGHLIGNMTITNDDDDVIFCLSTDIKLPIDF